MKEQIQQLIAAGQTKDALNLLVQMNPDALLLQAQYNNGEKQFNLGLVEFSEWQRIQSRVNFAALEMAGKTGGGTKPITNYDTPSPRDFAATSADNKLSAGPNRKVFISYNHKDKEMADRVKDFLEKEGVEVTIDREKMEAGQSISDFIKSNIRSNGYILSLVSENSLRSGWVGMESTASLFAEWIADKHFIPVALDDKWSSNEFYIDALRYINDTIKQKEKEAREVKKLQGRTTHIESQMDRLLDLRANLSQILEKLQSVLTVSITGDDFDEGMGDVLSVIKKA